MGYPKIPGRHCMNPDHDTWGTGTDADKVMGVLLENQGKLARHRCAYCAYEAGHKKGFSEGQKKGFAKGKKVGFDDAIKRASKRVQKLLFGASP